MAGPYFPVVVHAAAGSSASVTSAPSASASAKSGAEQGAPRAASFPKSSRLLKRASFLKVQGLGTRSGCAYYSVTTMRDESLDCPKVGLTAPKRLGNSVMRNLLRRRMREAIRQEIWRAQPGWAFVFHPRSAAAEAPIERLRAELEKLFRRCV